ncbi:UPF0481 protein At3g47200-like [Bidens hawaiensis]|uniref:UPF0481 protein At3g47200-like n=1 Tax=Bidens hawaiensis TaxID=980011 RepID=UPI00404B8B47
MDMERGEIVPNTVRSLLDYVGEKQCVTNKLSPSVYVVPSTLRQLSPGSFAPRVVSIGPLHREDENLKRFEGRKAAFVHDLLCRSLDSSPTQTFTACVQRVTSIIEKIKGCYAYPPNVEPYDNMELAQMMVTDACFILEFIHQMPKDSNIRLQDQHIPYDLLLLENQIPFFVLNVAYECTVNNFDERLSLAAFIHPLLKYTSLFQGGIKIGGTRSYTNHDHILGYLYHCYQPKEEISSGLPRSTIHSAVELDEAGVSFKPNEDAEWPMAMEVKKSRYCSCVFWFSFRSTLTMPTLRIDDFTELVLRNLTAYEQSYAVYPYVTSYARAMDMLIDTHEDIAQLVTSKVMINHIGSNEEAANMINRICKEVAPEHFCYAQQWEQLDIHFKSYWPRKLVKLKRTYFNSPWSIIALVAGFILFGLTTVQTIYAVKSS